MFFTFLLLLAFTVCAVASAATSADTITEWIDGSIGADDVLKRAELDGAVLDIVVDISGVDELYDGYFIDYATDRASSITDELLDHPEFDAEWDSILIEFPDVGYFAFSKDDIKTNEYNMRYMEVYNDDYSSRIVLVGEAPEPTAEPDVSETVIEALVRWRIGEYYDNTDIDSITINPNYGTDAPGDYVVLVRLTWNGKDGSARETLKMYSDDLAASMYEGSKAVQEIAIFWSAPNLSTIGAKCSYERKPDGMYLSDEMWGF